jgi:hypothetical protein
LAAACDAVGSEEPIAAGGWPIKYTTWNQRSALNDAGRVIDEVLKNE